MLNAQVCVVHRFWVFCQSVEIKQLYRVLYGATQYSKRVRDGVPGVVAVLLSPTEVASLAVMSPPWQKQP